MLLPVAALIIGLILLAWSADRFVFGAAAAARNLGVSPLVIGLTIVGFGTSAPELMIAAFAAWQGNPELAIGNAVGSNIANIGLVLGVAALVSPLSVRSQILKRVYPVMFIVMILTLLLMLDGKLDKIDGAVLVGGLVLLAVWTIHIGLKERASNHVRAENARAVDPLSNEYEMELKERIPLVVALRWLTLGLVVLLGSSRILVWGATEIAVYFGVSDLIIGLTIVAVGTSLPEVATSVAASIKGEDDIAVGNILGSNMFNMLGVMGILGLLHPTAFSAEVLSRDFPAMFLVSIAMLLMVFRRRGAGHINRLEGGLLLVGYTAYILILGQSLGLS